MALIETALAHVRPPGHDHLPRLDQVQPGGGMGQQGVNLPLGRISVAGLQRSLDLFDRLPQRAVILVQQDGGRARRAGVGQGKPSGGGKRIGFMPGGPLLPRNLTATAVNQQFFHPGNRRRSAVAMKLNSLVRDAG